MTKFIGLDDPMLNMTLKELIEDLTEGDDVDVWIKRTGTLTFMTRLNDNDEIEVDYFHLSTTSEPSPCQP